MDKINDEYIHKIWCFHHSLSAPIYKVRKELVLKLLPRQGESKLCLDAGCGIGEYTLELLKRGFRVHSFDLSAYAIRRLKEQLAPMYMEKFEGLVSDILDFDSNEKYDLILLSEVLEHVEDDLDALRKMGSLLKQNGEVIITVPYDPKLWSGGDIFSRHFRRYTLEGIERIIKKSDLSIKMRWIYGFPVLRIYSLLKKRFFKSSFIKRRKEFKIGKIARILSTILNYIETVVLFFDKRCLHSKKGVGLILVCTKVQRSDK